MTALIKYEAACRALAQARTAIEVKDIRDKAIAIKAYARQAKNKTLEADAFEIRIRSERRLGEVMVEQPKALPIPKSGKTAPKKLGFPNNPSLLSVGIDKNLANRARQLLKLSDKAFEVLIAEGREDVRRSVERSAFSKINRQEKHQNKTHFLKNYQIAGKGHFLTPGTWFMPQEQLWEMETLPESIEWMADNDEAIVLRA